MVHLCCKRCNWCSRQRPLWRVHQLTSGQNICDHCLEWHIHATDFLNGAVPAGCQACGITWEQMRERTIGDEVRLYVVPKDGIYQLLCRRCVQPYMRKRHDLYEGKELIAA